MDISWQRSRVIWRRQYSFGHRDLTMQLDNLNFYLLKDRRCFVIFNNEINCWMCISKCYPWRVASLMCQSINVISPRCQSLIDQQQFTCNTLNWQWDKTCSKFVHRWPIKYSANNRLTFARMGLSLKRSVGNLSYKWFHEDIMKGKPFGNNGIQGLSCLVSSLKCYKHPTCVIFGRTTCGQFVVTPSLVNFTFTNRNFVIPLIRHSPEQTPLRCKTKVKA